MNIFDELLLLIYCKLLWIKACVKCNHSEIICLTSRIYIEKHTIFAQKLLLIYHKEIEVNVKFKKVERLKWCFLVKCTSM